MFLNTQYGWEAVKLVDDDDVWMMMRMRIMRMMVMLIED